MTVRGATFDADQHPSVASGGVDQLGRVQLSGSCRGQDGPDGRGGREAQGAGAGADPRFRVQAARMEEAPAGRGTRRRAGSVA